MKNILALTGILGIAAVTAVWAADTNGQPKTEPANPPAQAKTAEEKPAGPAVPVDMGPIHNTFKLGRKIISGSCPEGEAGFQALAQQGVKTIISVDGMRPDATLARKFGMRYVHIPVPYSGINRAQALSIARAVRDLEGPVFIHCHHGIHRGPAAAVLAAMADEGWTNEQALSALHQVGTAPQYTGLWDAARDWKAPTTQELADADVSFPEVAQLPALAAQMVQIDEHWDHMGAVRKADWKAPAPHPDIDPPHEALLLKEDFREMARSPEIKKFPADFHQKLATAETAATALETALRDKDSEKAQQAYKAVGQSCGSCHAVYRNPSGLKPEAK